MKIVQGIESRYQEVFDLLRNCLGEKEVARRDLHYWRWKHEDNPYGSSIQFAAEDHGHLAGLRVLMYWRWHNQSGNYLSVRAVDTVTHPEYQRRGVFTMLNRFAIKKLEQEHLGFIFNTPNKNSLPGYLKMGWNIAANLELLVKPLRPLRIVSQLIWKVNRNDMQSISSYERCYIEKTRDDVNSLQFNEFLKIVTNLENLLENDRGYRGNGLSTIRGYEFLHWRYGKHPYLRYFVEVVGDPIKPDAFLIWRFNVRNCLKEIIVCDMIITIANRKTVRNLFNNLIRKVDADYLVCHFGQNSVHRSLIKSIGFIKVPLNGIKLTTFALGTDTAKHIDDKNLWSLCLGDLELF